MEKQRLTPAKLVHLFFTFFKIGLFTIGGGMVMMPVMQREFVEKQKWVDDEKMVEIFAVAQSLPGVIALNSSIYVGYEVYGVVGSIVAAAGIVLPSFFCILIVFFALKNVGPNVYLDRFYTGVRAAVVSLIALAAVKMGKSAIKDGFCVGLTIFGIVATVFLHMDIALIVVISGFAAYVYYTLREGRRG